MVLSFATCAVSVISLHKEPNHRSEQVSQLLYGERAEILLVQNDYWAYIRSWSDDYEGWCLIGQLRIVSKREFNQNPKFTIIGHGHRLSSSTTEMVLPQGAFLKKGSLVLAGEKAKLKGKKIETTELKPSFEMVEYYAKSYFASPYLWGGKTNNGIDCSGLSQMVMRLNGVSIARDASQQAAQGETVSFLQEAKCGDLAFFANAEGKINHVGILLNEHHIIHATETAGCVVIDKIDQEGIVSKLLRKRTHSLRLIKRFF